MSGEVFVDTNVLVYCRDASEPEKQALADAWMAELWKNRAGRLSYQVLQEFYVTVTAKLDPGLAPEAARDDVRALQAWKPLSIDDQVIEMAWFLQDRHRFPWWDALIMAAALSAGCRYLLSEDFHRGIKVGDIQVVNPFQTSFSELGF